MIPQEQEGKGEGHVVNVKHADEKIVENVGAAKTRRNSVGREL